MKKRMLVIVMTLLMVVTMIPSMAFADSATMTSAELEAQKENGIISLDGDVTISDKLSFKEDVIVEMNGHTIYLTKSDNWVATEKNVLFLNGTIDLSGTPDAGDGIIVVRGGGLTFDNVTVNAKDISSGAGTINVGQEGLFSMTNQSEINIENESCSLAYVLYANDGVKSEISIVQSVINVKNGNSGIYGGKTTITGSDINMSLKDNGINAAKNYMNMVVSASNVNIETEKGRAVTIDGSSTISFENGSIVNLISEGEAVLMYKSDVTDEGKISFDGTTKATLTGEGNTAPIVIEGTSITKAEDVAKWLGLAENLKPVFDADANEMTFVCEHKNTDTYDFDATCSETGIKGSLFCTECFELLAEGTEIPKTSNHEYKDGKCTVCGVAEPSTTPTTPDADKTDKTDETPKTSDDFNGTVPFALAALALVGMGAAVIGRKRHN